MNLPGSLEFESNRTAACGGLMNVKQPTAQQAPVVVNAQYKDYQRFTELKDRHRSGADDFESGAALFVACDPDSYTPPSSFTSRMNKLGHYLFPSEESQPGVFSSLEQVYMMALNSQPAGNPVARHAAAVQRVYQSIRSFGFADTPNSLQKDNRRYASGDWSVITRLAGDKTTVNTGWMHIGAGDDVVWFFPNDPVLAQLFDPNLPNRPNRPNRQYPFEVTPIGNPTGMPEPGTVKLRAILLPLILEVVTVDPNCVYRVVGKCMKPSKPNRALTLLVGTRPSVMPIAADARVAAAIAANVQAVAAGVAAAVPAPAPAPVAAINGANAGEFDGRIKMYGDEFARSNQPSTLALQMFFPCALRPDMVAYMRDRALAKLFSDDFRDRFVDEINAGAGDAAHLRDVFTLIANAVTSWRPNGGNAAIAGSPAALVLDILENTPECRAAFADTVIRAGAQPPPNPRQQYRRGVNDDAPASDSEVAEFNDDADLSEQE